MLKRRYGRRWYSRKWDKARLSHLAKHPSCVNIGQPGCQGAATCVDHIVDHKGNSAVFWNRKNWQSMCHHCHSVKTAKAMVRSPLPLKFDVHGEPTGGWT